MKNENAKGKKQRAVLLYTTRNTRTTRLNTFSVLLLFFVVVCSAVFFSSFHPFGGCYFLCTSKTQFYYFIIYSGKCIFYTFFFFILYTYIPGTVARTYRTWPAYVGRRAAQSKGRFFHFLPSTAPPPPTHPTTHTAKRPLATENRRSCLIDYGFIIIVAVLLRHPVRCAP